MPTGWGTWGLSTLRPFAVVAQRRNPACSAKPCVDTFRPEPVSICRLRCSRWHLADAFWSGPRPAGGRFAFRGRPRPGVGIPISASITCSTSRITYAIPKTREQRMLHSPSSHRAVIPSHIDAAEHCSRSVDCPFLKAPHRALSSFLAATSDIRDMGREGFCGAAGNGVTEDFHRILSAPDSRGRMNVKKVMSVR